MSRAEHSDAWCELTAHHDRLQQEPLQLSRLFEHDPRRADELSLSAANLFLDYSRNLITPETLSRLLDLSRERALPAAIDAMFDGEMVNITEQRAALHVAFRGHVPAGRPEIADEVADISRRMETLVEAVQQQRWTGFDGRAISDIVNIGIGGSDLGPAMVSEALGPWHHPELRCHFVSNVDPDHLQQTLNGLESATTLFIVASKSFTTAETLDNARRARRWILDHGGGTGSLARHFVAVSNNTDAAGAFGIDAGNILPLPEWVGGRYSLWSAIGLPVAMMVGMPAFRELLDGARHMDGHFREAPLEENMPVILGLLAYWYAGICDAGSQVMLPYAQRLRRLPEFLQQLEMESLGKSVHTDGNPMNQPGPPAVWGGTGSNSQHSFHQLLHQGSRLMPVDFIAVARPALSAENESHRQLLAHCFSQSQALMQGRSAGDIEAGLRKQGMESGRARWLAAHRQTPGNRPSTTILLPRLDPIHLGALIALYEHKVYVQSVLWRINAFDQWGVELGKQMSHPMYQALESGQDVAGLDSASQRLIRRCLEIQGSHGKEPES